MFDYRSKYGQNAGPQWIKIPISYMELSMSNTNPQHHLSIRKRIHEKFEKYPHPQNHKKVVDYLVYIVGILSPICTLPQVLKIWINKSAQDVSLLTWVPYSLFAMIWLWYGIIHKETPIIILNTGLIIVNLLVVIGVLFYG